MTFHLNGFGKNTVNGISVQTSIWKDGANSHGFDGHYGYNNTGTHTINSASITAKFDALNTNSQEFELRIAVTSGTTWYLNNYHHAAVTSTSTITIQEIAQ